MFNKIILLLIVIVSTNAHAQFIDKYIYQNINQVTSNEIIIDADNDGVDDFAFSYNSSTSVSLNIVTTSPNTAVGTFTANFSKAYFMGCNSVVDQNLNVTWNTLIAPFNSVPFLDPQYAMNFNYSGLGFSNLSLYKAGFIPIKVNNKYGYILIEFQQGTTKFVVYGSRVNSQSGTAVTIDCGTIGINDVEKFQNRFSVNCINDKCIVKNIRNINDIYVTDITGREIKFTSVKVNEHEYELQLAREKGILFCHSRITDQTVRFVR